MPSASQPHAEWRPRRMPLCLLQLHSLLIGLACITRVHVLGSLASSDSAGRACFITGVRNLSGACKGRACWLDGAELPNSPDRKQDRMNLSRPTSWSMSREEPRTLVGHLSQEGFIHHQEACLHSIGRFASYCSETWKSETRTTCSVRGKGAERPAFSVLAMASPTASWKRPVLSIPVCTRMQSLVPAASLLGPEFACSSGAVCLAVAIPATGAITNGLAMGICHRD